MYNRLLLSCILLTSSIFCLNKPSYIFDSQRGPNWWLYYFEPIKIMRIIPGTLKRVPNYMKFIKGSEVLFEMSRDRKNDLISKYIRINQEMLNKATTFIENYYADAFIIGLDYFVDKLPGCSPAPTFEDISKTIDKAIGQLPQDISYKIFVATNDKTCLHYMQQTFPDHIIYVDVALSDNTAWNAEIWLLNLLLLAQSNLFIDCGSLLSKNVTAFNLSLPIVQLDINWLEKE